MTVRNRSSLRPVDVPELLLDILSLYLSPVEEAALVAAARSAARRKGPVEGSPAKDVDELVKSGRVRREPGGLVLDRAVADARLAELAGRGQAMELEFAASPTILKMARAGKTLFSDARRKLRLALFSSNSYGLRAALVSVGHRPEAPLLATVLDRLGLKTLDSMPAHRRESLVGEAMVFLCARATRVPGLAEWLEANATADPFRQYHVESLVLEGKLSQAETVAGEAKVARAIVAMARGRVAEARVDLDEILVGRESFLGVLGTSLLPLSWLLQEVPDVSSTRHYLGAKPSTPALGQVGRLAERLAAPSAAFPAAHAPSEMGWPLLLFGLVLYWTDPDDLQVHLPRLERGQERAREAGLDWLAAEFGHLLGAARGDEPQGLVALRRRPEVWSRALEGLRRIVSERRRGQSPASERLVWELDPSDRHRLTPRLQKRAKKGGWTPGRQLSPDRLHELDCLTDEDRRVLQAWARTGRYGWGWELDDTAGLVALAGHPRIFRKGQPVHLVEGRPSLQFVRRNGHVRLAPATVLSDQPHVLREEEPGRFVVYRMEEVHRELARLVRNGLEFPAELEPELRDLLAPLADQVPLHSDVPVGDLPQVEADPSLHVLLSPRGDGFGVQVCARPLEDTWMAPGEGAAILTGVGVQVRRDLDEERRRHGALLEACPLLRAALEAGGGVEGPEECLDLLEDLAGRPQGLAELLWPEGEALQVPRRAELDQLHLRLGAQADWFGLDGSLPVDEGQVLELRRLLEHARTSPSRFVPLGGGRFLALSRELQSRLDVLADLATPRGAALEIHPLAALAVEQSGPVEADGAWRDRVEGVQRALAMKPRVPKTLQAELRDYQADGYRWLVRMSNWAPGACLADDMGLGKTVQALALLLQRASLGPALVVAPTSVGPNWVAEAARFAPSLRVQALAEERGLESLGPGDLVVASYGLLTREEALTEVRWATLILDEAQAIKNPTTRRFKAAVALQADFRLATTGTPVENRLDELWALFRFLAPGLLGSRERFQERFAGPIERDRDGAAHQRLQALARPFLLRRTKAQVLRELPPRTEVELAVGPGPEERALYEALRRDALERMDSAEGPNRMQVLAELMRLRRAACHPRLVDPGSRIPSAKMELFGEVMEELLAEGHRVLVFSQFVDHLALAREFLDGRGVTYQYLDGSTPARERARRVQAFQEGEGQAFLISLRAGGTGLNLTAADYVVHLDPWWNPAVEDQASDRAHRMGQTRPVTIYRLVARGTLEEKILRLHADKRQLAEGILAGADAPAAIRLEELVGLLREG